MGDIKIYAVEVQRGRRLRKISEKEVGLDANQGRGGQDFSLGRQGV